MPSKKTKIINGLGSSALILALIIASFSESAHAAETNVDFQVNVKESLSVKLTVPSTWASGSVNTFLRNKVSLDVATNSTGGFTASMFSSGSNTGANKNALVHSTLGSTYTIETLSGSSTRSGFPSDKWGYSLSTQPTGDTNPYGENDDGNNSSTYYPISASSTSPNTILYGASGTKTGAQNIYFGAKASSNKPSGTYVNTVVISVVTGAVDPTTNPITPTNPATPETDTNQTTDYATDTHATYTGGTGTSGATIGGGTNGTTVYTRTSTNTTNGTKSTTTTITEGDVTSQYPLGVNEKTDKTEGVTSNISRGSSGLATGLAVTASVAAASGIFFLVAARRRKDDDEDEDAGVV